MTLFSKLEPNHLTVPHSTDTDIMKILKFIFLTLALISIVSCEKNADISKPINYSKDGISFAHPGNWKVTEDAHQDDVRFMFIETPGNAIVMIQIYPKQDAVSLNEYAEWFSSEVIKETPVAKRSVGKFANINTTLDGTTLTGMRQNFSIALLGIDVPHTAEYYRIEKGNKVAFLINQTATEDLTKVSKGFELLLGSFAIN